MYIFKIMFAEENFSYPPSRKVMVRPLYPESFFKLHSQSNKPCSRGLAKSSENPKAPPSVPSEILVAKCHTVDPNYPVTP